MLIDEDGYPKLMKEFVIKNDGIPHGLVKFKVEIFVGKNVLDIRPPNVPVVDESVFGNMLSLQSEAIYGCITCFLYQVGTHATLEYGEYCLCQLVKHVESHGIQSLISVPSLISDILSVKNKYIVICDDEIDAAPSVLTLSYTLNVGKDVVGIVFNICSLIHVYEADLVFDGEMLNLFHPNLLLLPLHLCGGDEDMMLLLLYWVHKKLWGDVI